MVTVLDIFIKACIALFLLMLLSVCVIVMIVAIREFWYEHRRK